MKLNTDILRVCAQACVNSYRGEYGKVVEIFDDIINIDIGKVEWSFGFKGDILYIVFRGSDGKADWKDNLTYEQVNYEMMDIKLHKGFYENQYLLAKREIVEYVYNKKIRNIIVTGHSLGGALATICAFDLKSYFKDYDISCVAIASPRSGDKNYKKEFNKLGINTIVIQYKNDMVVKVPPRKIFNYNKIKLFGKIPFIIPKMPLIINYEHVVEITKIGKVKWYEKIFKRSGNPLDHYPKYYLEHIDEVKLK